tara:strand:- start:367 stop:516 length:150 start_codon:yes stop_codon:yes gene_type:complete
MGKRKYISYLRDMVKYWRKKAKSSDSYTKAWAEGMYETFREKLEKEKSK